MVSRRHTRRLAASRPPPLASPRRRSPRAPPSAPSLDPLHLPSPLEHRANLVPKRTRGSNRRLNRNMNRRGHRRALTPRAYRREVWRASTRRVSRRRSRRRPRARSACGPARPSTRHPNRYPNRHPNRQPNAQRHLRPRSKPSSRSRAVVPLARRAEESAAFPRASGRDLSGGAGSILEDAFEFVPSASKRRARARARFCGGGTRGSTRLRRLASFVVASMAFSRGLRAATLGEVQENAHRAPRAHGDGERLHASVDARGAGGSRANARGDLARAREDRLRDSALRWSGRCDARALGPKWNRRGAVGRFGANRRRRRARARFAREESKRARIGVVGDWLLARGGGRSHGSHGAFRRAHWYRARRLASPEMVVGVAQVYEPSAAKRARRRVIISFARLVTPT